MKILILLTLLIGLSNFALALDQQSTDSMAQTFHERLTQREPQIFEGAQFSLSDNPPDQVKEVIEKSLDELLQFATELDLFSRGFSYDIAPLVYKATKGSEVIDYTFSLRIYKNGVATFRRFYNLARRVDGVFYVDHIATYDF